MFIMKNIGNYLKKHYDAFYAVLAPILSAAIIFLSLSRSYDFRELREAYPNWRWLFDFLEAHILTSLLICAGCLVLLSILHIFCRPTIKKLQKDLDDITGKNELIGENVKNVFDGYLFCLSKKLGFGSQEKNCERVTIYIHDGTNHFIPFGRYSANPSYNGPGRTTYPDKQGCIAKGWENGWHFENNLGKGGQYEKNNQKKYSIDKETLDRIKMKSELYAVQRIDGKNGRKLAVIVVESTTKNRFEKNNLKKKIEEEMEYVADLIVKLEDHIPSLGNAKRRGF